MIIIAVMNKILAHIVPEKSIVELCAAADKEIEDETAKIYNKIKMDKGIAFPTCISVNNCAGHFSPLASEDKTLLKQGDLVKMCVVFPFFPTVSFPIPSNLDRFFW
jgi:methionine aminopeptidase